MLDRQMSGWTETVQEARSIRPGGYRHDFFGSFYAKTKRMYSLYGRAIEVVSGIAHVLQASRGEDKTETVSHAYPHQDGRDKVKTVRRTLPGEMLGATQFSVFRMRHLPGSWEHRGAKAGLSFVKDLIRMQ